MLGIFNIVVLMLVSGFIAVGSLGIGFIPIIIYLVCIFHGAEKRRIVAYDQINRMLMAQEVIVAQATQLRPLALFSRRSIVTITNSRVIVTLRRLLGGYDPQDFQWKELIDVTISANAIPAINGVDLSFQFNFGHDKSGTTKGYIKIRGLTSDDGPNIYRYAHAEEQAWQEKRRVRVMEEDRAAAGGVYIAQSPAMGSFTPQGMGNGIVDELQKAKSLIDAGLISDVEYQEMKSKILNGNFGNTLSNR